MNMTIGVIGGMGNEAMADLADNIDSLSGSDSHSYVLYGNSRQAFTPDEADGEWEEGDEPLLRKRHTGEFTAALLQNLGASRAGLSCNGGHPLFRKIYEELDTKFVDMIAETAAVPDADSGVLVLGTKRTLKSRLYDDDLERREVQTFQPTSENRQRVMDAIYDPEDGIKTGIVTEQAVDLLCGVIRDACSRHASIDTVVLGCTELPLALNDDRITELKERGELPEHLQFVDPTQVLGQALLTNTDGETPPETVELSSYQRDHLDFDPPFACRVTSLSKMVTFQTRLVEWTMEYFQERGKTVGGSYLHLPTLFFVNYDRPIPINTDQLDMTIHDYNQVPEEPDVNVERALKANFESVSHLV